MLKNPDVFISTSDKVFNFIEHHLMSFLAVVLVAAVGSVAWVTVGWLDSRKEQKAAEALYGPEAELKKAEAKVKDERAKRMQDLVGGKKKEDIKNEVRPVDY